MKRKYRNQVATSPLLKKSGMHLSESPKAQNKKSRSEAKNNLKPQNLEVYFF